MFKAIKLKQHWILYSIIAILTLITVVLGVILNSVFGKFFHYLWIEKEHLVSIPEIKLNNLTSIITFPDFSQIMNYQVWVIGLTIAIIASLETLLNLEENKEIYFNLLK